MNDSLKPLMFTVGLIDRISGPASRATKSFSGLINTAKSGFEDIRSGATGLAATGFLIYQGLTPAIEMNRALAEVGSIGIQEKALSKLGKTALKLSADYGLAAVEVVNSGSLISKSIKGLSGGELSAFTHAAGVLSVTTKSGMEETSRYLAQMYTRFQDTAEAMGRSNWVAQLVSQTQYLNSELGTSTEEIADAMQGLNNLGSGLGVGMSEQLAILGTLSKSTGISDAEQQYTAFLERAVEAQDKLGMSFVDESTGSLLSMVDILDKLTAQFGDMSGAESWAMLDEAFGDGSKLIQQLSKDTAGLGKTIKDLGKITGFERVSAAADTMTDPWKRLSGAVVAVKTSIGQALVPVIEPAIQWLAEMGGELLRLTQLFPNITKVVGVSVVSILGLAASMAALAIVVGIGKAAFAGWLLITRAQIAITAALAAVQWLLNAAFIASPIGWIVLGFVALLAALYAVWQGVKLLWGIFSESAAGKFLIGLIDDLVAWFKSLGGVVDWVIDKLNMIPGVNIDVSDSASTGPIDYRNNGMGSDVPLGGITQQISRSMADSSRSSTTVNIQTTEAITPRYVQDQLWQVAP